MGRLPLRLRRLILLKRLRALSFFPCLFSFTVVVRRVADSLFSHAPGSSRGTFDSQACLSSCQSESVRRSAADVPICVVVRFFSPVPLFTQQ